MTKISSAPVVAWTFYVFACVTAGSSALATDLVVDSSVLFSALDGGASEQDSLANGLLPISSRTITGSEKIVLNLPMAEFHVLGDVHLGGRSAIRTR